MRIDSYEKFLEFIEKKYNGEYEILSDSYSSTKDKISVRHVPCGKILSTTADKMIQGSGCKSCKLKKSWKTRSNAITDAEFKIKVSDLLDDEYKFLEPYNGYDSKIKIVHLKCGHEYSVTPNKFISGRRCPSCNSNIKKIKYTKTLEQFKKDVFELFGNEYSVTGNEYINCRTKIKISHKCGEEFLVTPNCLLCGKKSCLKCKTSESNGHKKIRKILTENGAFFKEEYKFKDCKNIRELPFDFVVFNDKEFDNIKYIIEFDGVQHFDKKSIYYSDDLVANDIIKNNYCADNGYRLIRIPYKSMKDIEKILCEILDKELFVRLS